MNKLQSNSQATFKESEKKVKVLKYPKKESMVLRSTRQTKKHVYVFVVSTSLSSRHKRIHCQLPS